MSSKDQATEINLDANANAQPTEPVIQAVERALRRASNPSSAHGGGTFARVEVEAARDAVSALVEGAYPENVIFTSGCTEANNQVIQSALRLGAAIITSAVEHPSVGNAVEAAGRSGATVHVLPVSAQGVIELATLAKLLEDLSGPILVSIQAANSETGVLQPLEAISAIVRARPESWLHSDAAQAFGKVNLKLGSDGVDVLTISGHKLHAPMGVGALLLADEVDQILPMLLGGDQEAGRRAGTQAVPLIAGLGAACAERRASMSSDIGAMTVLRDHLESRLLDSLPGSWVNGAGAPRLPNTVNLGIPGVDGTALVSVLDGVGVYASQGSACHSRRPEASPVLRAMGLSEDAAYSSVRFSVSPLNTMKEIEVAVRAIVSACQRLEIRA